MSTLMTNAVGAARTRIPRLAGDAVLRARLTVIPRRAQRAKRLPFVALVALILGVGVAGLLTFNTQMQQGSFTISSLQGQADAITARQQSVQMELQQLRDPQELAVRAHKLGMVVPPAPVFIELANGKVLGTPQAATSADAMRINPPAAKKPVQLAPKPRKVTVVLPFGVSRFEYLSHRATRKNQ